MTIGAIGFLQPWMLAALAALPAIWWLLRFTPPSPHLVVFPPTRLLKDLKTTEETPAHSPWWLTALRMLLAALIILALAASGAQPRPRRALPAPARSLLVIDNGWASAAHWPERREAIEAAIDRAGRDGRTIVLAPTAPGQPVSDPLTPRARRASALAGLTPQPYAPDRAALAATLERDLGGKTDYSVRVALRRSRLWRGRRARPRPSPSSPARPAASPCLRPGKDDAALALGQAIGEGGGLAARVLSSGGWPARGRGQGADRTRRAARRSAIRHWRGRQRGDRQVRAAARDPQSGRAPRDRRRALGRRRPSPRCPLAMASRRHRLGRIARGGAAAAVASLLCAARALALRRRRHAGGGQCRDRASTS